MGLNPIVIRARDLPDAWFQCVDACLTHGRQWTVEEGSYEGQKRWELDHVTVHITHPGTRPLVPEMPPHINAPPPTTSYSSIGLDTLGRIPGIPMMRSSPAPTRILLSLLRAWG